MNSLKRLIGTPIFLKKALEDLTATSNFCLSRTSWKDEKTTEGNDGDSDQDKDKSHKHKNRNQFSKTGKDLKPTSTIKSFQIYKKIPKDIDELFLKRNERFKYRNMNELYKKEINQLFLREKDLMRDNQSNLDSKKLSPVAFGRNTVFDEKLDNMVKTLLSETRSVITKMARLSSTSKRVPPVTFEEVKEKLLMSKKIDDPCACDLPPETSNSGESSGGAGQSGGRDEQNPPAGSSGDVIVSPYVDDKGNIDYTRAVVKSSSSGDASARDIIKKLIVDPPKPLPTFEIPNAPRTTEIIVIRGDGTIESKNENISHVEQAISDKTPNISKPESEKPDKTKNSEQKRKTKYDKEVPSQTKQDCKPKSMEQKIEKKSDPVIEKVPSHTKHDCKPKSMEQKIEKKSDPVIEKVPSHTKHDCKPKSIEQKIEKKSDQAMVKVPSQTKQDCKPKSKEQKIEKTTDQVIEKLPCKPKSMEQKIEKKSDHAMVKVPSQTKQDCKPKSMEQTIDKKSDQAIPEPKEEINKCSQEKGKVSSETKHHDFKTKPKVFRTGCIFKKAKSRTEDSKVNVNPDKDKMVMDCCTKKKSKISEKEKKTDKPPKEKPDGKCG